MASHWTYDVALLESASVGYYAGSTVGIRYQIRLLIQDTNTNRQLFQDEEIDWVQTVEANTYTAAAALCDTLVAKAGGVQSKRVGELAISYDPRFYQSLAATLRARGAGHQVPYAGGISAADKLAQQSDTDWVQPSINRGQSNNPLAPSPADPPVVAGGSNGGLLGGQ